MTKTHTIETLGLSGKEYIKRLEKKGFKLSKWAKDVLLSKDFTSSKKSYEIVIVNSSDVGEYPTTTQIREYAKEKGYLTPSPDVACALRESITNKEMEEMGLWWIVTMHDPIKDSLGDPYLLDASRDRDGQWLDTAFAYPGGEWLRENGFAFVVPQVGTQDSDTQKSELNTSSLDLAIKQVKEAGYKVTKEL